MGEALKARDDLQVLLEQQISSGEKVKNELAVLEKQSEELTERLEEQVKLTQQARAEVGGMFMCSCGYVSVCLIPPVIPPILQSN